MTPSHTFVAQFQYVNLRAVQALSNRTGSLLLAARSRFPSALVSMEKDHNKNIKTGKSEKKDINKAQAHFYKKDPAHKVSTSCW